MIFRRCSLIVMFFGLALFSLGQSFTLLNYDGKTPIVGAEIFSFNTSKTYFSDKQGKVKMGEMISGELFVFSSIGFQKKIYTAEQIKTNSTLYLFPKTTVMDRVEIIHRNGRQERVKDLPNQIRVISTAEIRRKNMQSSADILQSTGTVLVQKSQMGGGSPILRGFEANKVLLVLDGVRMNNAIYRAGHLQNAITIDNNILQQTEIVFGPGSVIYGSDALGGVIHYRTKSPRLTYEDSLENKSVSFMGRMSSANQEQSYHVNASVGYKNFGFVTSVTTANYGDLKMGENRSHGDETWGLIPTYSERVDGTDVILQNPDPSVQKHTGFKQWDFLQKLVYSPKEEVKFGLNFSYSTSTNVPRFDRYNDYLSDGTPKWAEWDYGPQDRLLLAFSTDILEETKWFDENHTVVALQSIKEERIQRRFGKNIRETQSESVQVFSLNSDFIKEFENELRFKYGVEITYNDVQSEASALNIETRDREDIATRYPDGGSDMQTLAAYIGWNKKFLNKTKLNLGARYSRNILNAAYLDNSFYDLPFDKISYNKGAFTGSVGVIFEIDTTFHINALASSGYRTPNVDDVGKVREKDGFITIPNDDVSPEYAYNGELSLRKKFFDHKLQVAATGYYTLLSNAIVNRETTLNGVDSLEINGEMAKITTNMNASQAYIYGYNIGINAEITEEIELNATYNYTVGYDVSDDFPLGHIPPVFGRVQATFEKNKFSATINSMFNAKKKIEDYGPGSIDNPAETLADGNPAWWTLNFYSSFYVSPNVELQFSVENLLDKHYKQFASGLSAPGRNFVLSARATF